jgi:Lrp/AsnC family leucine-responsive transcriptional regulator
MKRVRYSNGALDETDARILEALSRDGRLPMKDLAQKVGLSAPSVTERVKRLEEAGVIEGYAAQINAAAVGLPLAVYIRVRPMPGELARVAELLASIPEIVECDRVTGDDCFIAKAHVQSVRDLETVIDRLLPYAMTNTSVIQSSPVRRRMPVRVRQ